MYRTGEQQNAFNAMNSTKTIGKLHFIVGPLESNGRLSVACRTVHHLLAWVNSLLPAWHPFRRLPRILATHNSQISPPPPTPPQPNLPLDKSFVDTTLRKL